MARPKNEFATATADVPSAVASSLPVGEAAASSVLAQMGDSELPEPTFSGMLAVRSVSARGRWRIGLHFTQEVTELDAAALTPEQLAALAADPELICAISD